MINFMVPKYNYALNSSQKYKINATKSNFHFFKRFFSLKSDSPHEMV